MYTRAVKGDFRKAALAYIARCTHTFTRSQIRTVAQTYVTIYTERAREREREDRGALRGREVEIDTEREVEQKIPLVENTPRGTHKGSETLFLPCPRRRRLGDSCEPRRRPRCVVVDTTHQEPPESQFVQL